MAEKLRPLWHSRANTWITWTYLARCAAILYTSYNKARLFFWQYIYRRSIKALYTKVTLGTLIHYSKIMVKPVSRIHIGLLSLISLVLIILHKDAIGVG